MEGGIPPDHLGGRRGGVSEEEGEKGGEEKRGFDRWLQANGKFLIIVLISYVDKRQGYRCLVMLHCLFGA